MVSHKLMGIYMGVLILGVYYGTWFLLVKLFPIGPKGLLISCSCSR